MCIVHFYSNFYLKAFGKTGSWSHLFEKIMNHHLCVLHIPEICSASHPQPFSSFHVTFLSNYRLYVFMVYKETYDNDCFCLVLLPVDRWVCAFSHFVVAVSHLSCLMFAQTCNVNRVLQLQDPGEVDTKTCIYTSLGVQVWPLNCCNRNKHCSLDHQLKGFINNRLIPDLAVYMLKHLLRGLWRCFENLLHLFTCIFVWLRHTHIHMHKPPMHCTVQHNCHGGLMMSKVLMYRWKDKLLCCGRPLKFTLWASWHLVDHIAKQLNLNVKQVVMEVAYFVKVLKASSQSRTDRNWDSRIIRSVWMLCGPVLCILLWSLSIR